MPSIKLEIIRPDDWHLHLRDDDVMQAVLPLSSGVFGRAIIMPNLIPPVRTASEAAAYRDRIVAALPEDHRFEPLMTCYLTDTTDPDDLRVGYSERVFTAAKLYPAGATTNSESGVTNVANIPKVLAAMETIGMPLLLHGEVTDPAVDVFDRETRFIDSVLEPLRQRHPGLKIVLEHVSTKEGVQFVYAHQSGMAATITPHHLMINRNAMFKGGIRPHMYCLPVAKREIHRQALRTAATSGDSRFFLGSDSAPHTNGTKENACGCAGIFNAPTTMACLAQVFDEEGALHNLEKFASLNGPVFYGLPANADTIILRKFVNPVPHPLPLQLPNGETITIFDGDQPLYWAVASV